MVDGVGVTMKIGVVGVIKESPLKLLLKTKRGRWVKAEIVRKGEGFLKVSTPLPLPSHKILIVHLSTGCSKQVLVYFQQ